MAAGAGIGFSPFFPYRPNYLRYERLDRYQRDDRFLRTPSALRLFTRIDGRIHL